MTGAILFLTKIHIHKCGSFPTVTRSQLEWSVRALMSGLQSKFYIMDLMMIVGNVNVSVLN